MIFEQYNTVFIYILAIVAILIAIKLFFTPIKVGLKLLFNGALGILALFVINLIGTYFGFSIPFNLVSALIAGLLGLPGIVLLFFLKLIGI